MIERIKGLWRDEEGQAMVEYGLIIAIISIAAIATMILLGPKIKNAFDNVNNNMP